MSNSRLNKLEVPDFLLKDDPSCAQVDPEMFFPVESETINNRTQAVYRNLAEAKEICRSCPLIVDCLAYALKNGEIGIWGGTTEDQRVALRRRHGISGIRRYRTPITW